MDMATTEMYFLNTTGYPVYHDNKRAIYDIINTVFIAISWILVPINLLGLITNSLNVIIYAKNGISDTVTICFFALSLCDLCYIIMRNFTNLFNLVWVISPSLLFHVSYDSIRAGFYESMVFEMSALIKTFIAVQRGCCIAFPFHVSRIFTNKRTTAVMVCLCLLSLASYVSNEFMDLQNFINIPVSNNTHFQPSFFNYPVWLSNLIRDIVKAVVVFTCEVLVVLSLIVIVYGMSSALKYRQMVSGKTSDSEQKQKIHNRDMRVVKQVILVSAIHLVCYIPVLSQSVFNQLALKGYIPYYSYYILIALDDLKDLAGPINAAINFFIYCSYNSKFRNRLINMCRREHDLTTRSVFTTEQLTVDQT